MKYSILMPYHNRLRQFQGTLFSMLDLYQGRFDFEIVMVVDGKSQNDMPLLKDALMGTPFQHQLISGFFSTNPSRACNN